MADDDKEKTPAPDAPPANPPTDAPPAPPADTPPPPPAPDPPRQDDDLRDTVKGLTETVAGLVTTVTTLVDGARRDVAPTSVPWTHRGSRRP